jgi:hypothetical protein
VQPRQASVLVAGSQPRTQGATMPLINVKVIEGVFTPEQKTQIA